MESELTRESAVMLARQRVCQKAAIHCERRSHNSNRSCQISQKPAQATEATEASG